MARDKDFKGVFAVVSDPVDLLCKAVYDISNKNDMGAFDYDGLLPEQIEGFGLGVMYARAKYFAGMEKTSSTSAKKEGHSVLTETGW